MPRLFSSQRLTAVIAATLATGAVAIVLRSGDDLPEVTAALRLGQTHGARVLAAHQRWQVLVLELLSAMRHDRVERTL